MDISEKAETLIDEMLGEGYEWGCIALAMEDGAVLHAMGIDKETAEEIHNYASFRRDDERRKKMKVYLAYGYKEKVQEVEKLVEQEMAHNPNLNGANIEVLLDDVTYIDGGCEQAGTSLLRKIQNLLETK